jgi:hypothetical protein
MTAHRDAQPATPCDQTEAHAAQLDFYGECAWCGAVAR